MWKYTSVEKEPLYPFDRKLGGFQSQYRRCGKQQNLSLCRESNLDSPDAQPEAYLLYWQSFPAPSFKFEAKVLSVTDQEILHFYRSRMCITVNMKTRHLPYSESDHIVFLQETF
jgi:hypothetical protein